MKPNASTTWIGSLKRGKGVVTTESGILSQSQYSGTGDEGGKGANPYELIAAVTYHCCALVAACIPCIGEEDVIDGLPCEPYDVTA